MASTPTPRNRLNRQGTGDNVNAWGGILNTQDFDLIDESLDGVAVIPVAGNVTASSVNYATDQARKRVLKFTGAGGFTVTIPGVEKFYIVDNACAAAVTIKTIAGASVTIATGQRTFLYCDGLHCFGATNTGSALFTSTVIGPAATTGRASFRAPPGTAPVSPINGDIWTTLARGLQYQVGSLTVGPASELLVSGETPAVGVAAIDLSLVGDFRAYDILLTDFRAAQTGRVISLRVSVNNGVSYRANGTDYKYLYDSISSAGVRGIGGGLGNGIILAGDVLINADPGGNAMINVRIEHPHNTNRYKMVRHDAVYEHNSDGALYHLHGGGRFNGGLNAITNARILADLGNIHAIYALYGIR